MWISITYRFYASHRHSQCLGDTSVRNESCHLYLCLSHLKLISVSQRTVLNSASGDVAVVELLVTTFNDRQIHVSWFLSPFLFSFSAGPRLNIKTIFPGMGISIIKISRSCYLYNGNSYVGKTALGWQLPLHLRYHKYFYWCAVTNVIRNLNCQYTGLYKS